MGGRKKKPLSIVRFEGNPGKRKLPSEKEEVRDVSELPDCPEELDENGQNEWRRILPLLSAMGLVGGVDRAALAGYCAAYSQFIWATETIKAKGYTFKKGKEVRQRPEVFLRDKALDKIKAFCIEFGMTPSSRARMSMPGKKSDDDEMEKLLRNHV